MKKFIIILLVGILLSPSPASAFLGKRDYKQNFLKNAQNAEKRKNFKSAFYIYEKTMFYYKDDKVVLESYAGFCERNKFYDRASTLYKRLYEITKDDYYLYKHYAMDIANKKPLTKEAKDIFKDNRLSSASKSKLSSPLIMKFFNEKDYKNTKLNCDKTTPKNLDIESARACITTSEVLKDKKGAFNYYKRLYELEPQNTDTVKKIISLAKELGEYGFEERFTQVFSILNPDDKGIKYSLAGLYEKHGQWEKAKKVYEDLISKGDKSKHVKDSLAYVKSQLSPQKAKPPTKEAAITYKPKPLTGDALREKLLYESLDKKDFKTAEGFLEQLLKTNPKSQKFVKLRHDVAMAQDDYPSALTYLIKLNEITPLTPEEERVMAFLYSKTGEYKNALSIIQNQLKSAPDDEKLLNLALEYTMAEKNWDIALDYIDKLLSKTPQDEKLLKLQGDLFSAKQDFKNAIFSYEKLVKLYPKDEYYLSLANFYMAENNFSKAEKIARYLYTKTPENNEFIDLYLNSLIAQNKIYKAQTIVKKHHLENTKNGLLVLGNIEIKNENYKKSREYFNEILKKEPDFRPAKMGLITSYLSNGDSLKVLETARPMPQDNEIRLIEAETYFKMGMPGDAKEVLHGSVSKKADELGYKIAKEQAVTIIPTYELMTQNLAREFQLNYNRVGFRASQKSDDNIETFAEYNLYNYQSGEIQAIPPAQSGVQYNFTNEVKIGIEGRPREKDEIRIDVGAKIFRNEGAMLNTDSWIKHYFNDNFNLKLGFYRNNLEQSYLSAVGLYVDNVFTGQTANNKVYGEFEYKFPKRYYSFGRCGLGMMMSQNLADNPYIEGMLGVGKLVYYNEKNKWINSFNIDLVSYNSSYKYNQLDIYDSLGNLYGGFFSPSYFSANTVNAKVEGKIKKLHLKYGLSGFAGVQFARRPHLADFTWGISPYLAYDLNDNITVKAAYTHFNYGDIQRNLFTVNMIIRFFTRDAKKQ